MRAAESARPARNTSSGSGRDGCMSDLREALAMLADAERGEVLDGVRELIEGED